MKGQGVDLLTIIIIVFSFIIAIAVVYWIWNYALLPAPTYQKYFNATPTQQTINNGVTHAEYILNNAGLVLLIVMALISVILAALSEANILVLFISIFLLLPEILLSLMFHDLFFDLVTNTFLGQAVGTSSLIVFQFFTAICLGMWIVTVIATFAK